MKTTVLLPHFRTGAMTCFSVNQFLRCAGRHQMNLVIIDTGGGVGMDEIPKHPDVTVIAYPEGVLQSHGLAFDHVLQNHWDLIEECFVTAESDSFPTSEKWLDAVEEWVNDGVDLAGSRLKLSGGEYVHPAGALYRKSNWLEAMEDVKKYGYHFYDHLVPPCYSLMSKELIPGAEAKRISFLPVAEGVFHQGMGFNDEELSTYGQRNMESEPPTILPREGKEQYLRIGYEPGQFFSYWHVATGKKIKEVPTEIRWIPNRENQAQDFTLMENGFKHLWGITAYTACENGDNVSDVVAFKRDQLKQIISTN